MRRPVRRIAGVLVALLFAVALFASCKSAPPPSPAPTPPPPVADTDGTPEGAIPLEIGIRHRDQLDCAARDCVDWYRLHAPEPGRLRIDAYLQSGEVSSPYEVELRKGDNEPLATAKKIGPGQRGIEVRVESGDYLIRVETGKDNAAIQYEIAAYFQHLAARPPPPPVEPKPAPPSPKPSPPAPPRYRIVEAEVLEVEGDASHPDSVLISQGRQAGIRPGMRGRLLEHGASIATIEVVDAYPDGSRARVDGAPRSTIKADAKVEIDVPIDSRGGSATGDSDASPTRPF